MSAPIRILHLPGRTPYARKLRSAGMVIVNAPSAAAEGPPRDATFEWLESCASFDFFDVLHVQSIELARTASIGRVLQRCVAERKGIVFTLHELDPLFPVETPDFEQRVRHTAPFASTIITLTESAAEAITARWSIDRSRIAVIPHGPILPPEHPLWTRPRERKARFTLGMFGGIRPNRSFLTAAVNALHGLAATDITVNILTRGLNPIELSPGSEGLALAQLAAADPRLSLRLLPFPSDEEIAEFVHRQDVLILPYLFGTHSGQLELAFDLGVPVVAPGFGCFRAQWQLHADAVPEPYWFLANPAAPYSFGTPLLEALRAAESAWQTQPTAHDREAFRLRRAREEYGILRAHESIYAGSLKMPSTRPDLQVKADSPDRV